MSEEFKIEIISPDKSIYSGETKEVILPCFEGQVTILKDHIPLITFLRPGIIVIKGNEEKKYFVEDGIAEFANNILLILTSTARLLSELNKNLITNLLNEAEKQLKSDKINDKKKYLLSYKIDTLREINQ